MEDEQMSQMSQENKLSTSYGSFQLKPKAMQKNTDIDSLGNLSNLSGMSGNLSRNASNNSLKKEGEVIKESIFKKQHQTTKKSLFLK